MSAPVCSNCVSGTVHVGPAEGKDITLGELPCYYAAPPAGLPPAPTVVILTDVFGHGFINTRLLADAYARSNLHVLVPDILSGDPIPPESMSSSDNDPPTTLLGKLWDGLGFIAKLPGLIPWFVRHGTSATLPHVHAALRDARAWSVERGNGRLGAVGFCFGGRYAILAAGEPAPLVDAYAACHPSGVAVPADLLAVRRPGLLCLAETDAMFPAAAVAEARRILGSPGAAAPAEIVTYPGTAHGFAVRGGPSVASQRAAAREKVAAFFVEALRAPGGAPAPPPGGS